MKPHVPCQETLRNSILPRWKTSPSQPYQIPSLHKPRTTIYPAIITVRHSNTQSSNLYRLTNPHFVLALSSKNLHFLFSHHIRIPPHIRQILPQCDTSSPMYRPLASNNTIKVQSKQQCYQTKVLNYQHVYRRRVNHQSQITVDEKGTIVIHILYTCKTDDSTV